MTAKNWYDTALELIGETDATVYEDFLPGAAVLTLQKMYPTVKAYCELFDWDVPAYPTCAPDGTDAFPYDVVFFAPASYLLASVLTLTEDPTASEFMGAEGEALLKLVTRQGKATN